MSLFVFFFFVIVCVRFVCFFVILQSNCTCFVGCFLLSLFVGVFLVWFVVLRSVDFVGCCVWLVSFAKVCEYFVSLFGICFF